MAKKGTQFDKVIEVPVKRDEVETVRKLRVIILKESDEGIVYIPMNAINRIDYNRLKKLYESTELDLLTALRDERLDNGRNALVTYKDIIQTFDKVAKKKEEEEKKAKAAVVESERPTRRKPGPKPGAKAKREAEEKARLEAEQAAKEAEEKDDE